MHIKNTLNSFLKYRKIFYCLNIYIRKKENANNSRYITHLGSKSKECPRSHANMRSNYLRHSLFAPMVRKIQPLRSGAWCECGTFGPLGKKLVYYAPREEKTWTVRQHASPSARVSIHTSCGLANFTPVERILFFLLDGAGKRQLRFAQRPGS